MHGAKKKGPGSLALASGTYVQGVAYSVVDAPSANSLHHPSFPSTILTTLPGVGSVAASGQRCKSDTCVSLVHFLNLDMMLGHVWGV